MSDKKALENAIEAIMDKMLEKGALTPQMYGNLLETKNQIAEQIIGKSDEFGLDLNKDNLLDPKIQKTLMGIVASKAIKNDELSDKFLNSLNPKQENSPENEKNLDKNMFLAMKILEVVKKVLKENKDEKMTPKQFADKLRDELKKTLNKCLGENKEQDEKLDKALGGGENSKDPLSEGLRNIFGGDDPRMAGEIPSVVVGPILGNLFGFSNQTQPNPNSAAFMVESNTFNPSKADYMGTEFSILINDIADGISSAVESTASKSITPLSTEPPPPK